MNDFREIIQALKKGKTAVVGVDGDLGAGKTTIANELAAALQCACLHLDSFLNEGQGTFLPSIQFDRLGASLKGRTGVIVVEGICLLAALEKVSLAPDYLIFVDSQRRSSQARTSPLLRGEVQRYIAEYSPRSRADAVVCLEETTMDSSNEVDIAYIRSKTLISVVLAAGGLVQGFVGALLLNAGLSEQGTATLKVMGAEISATGLGGVALGTSAVWAYLAYLSRPKFSHRSESRSVKRADGSTEMYEFHSATQMSAKPPSRPKELQE